MSKVRMLVQPWVVLGVLAAEMGMARAIPTPQQNCDSARITAWKIYQTCVDTVVAKEAKGFTSFDFLYPRFAKCRHTYFKKWTGFQARASLAGTTCIGTRFTDNGDQTVTDNLSGLMWEKKDNASGIHDKDDVYSWSAGAPYKGDGTAYATFLTDVGTGLNVAGFAAANDWRLPTLAELQTIVLDFPCTGGIPTCVCSAYPCVDPALDAANTQPSSYWSATTLAGTPSSAWVVDFAAGNLSAGNKTLNLYVRGVRGGL